MQVSTTNPEIHSLNKEELENPELVFQQFFEIDNLAGMKKTIRQIFEDLIKRQFRYEPGSMGYDDTLYLFEKLEKLMEAAYLLRN